jgi:hypothetical protein
VVLGAAGVCGQADDESGGGGDEQPLNPSWQLEPPGSCDRSRDREHDHD